MPLTEKGHKIMRAMVEEYGEEKGKQVFYASKNAKKITGVDTDEEDEETMDGCACFKPRPPIVIRFNRGRK